MKIKGDSIYLRPITKEDLTYFVAWLSDKEVNHFLQGRSFTMEEELEWFQLIENDPKESIFSVILNQTGEIIGNCGIHAHHKRDDVYDGECFIGLMIGKKEEWGKGYGTEIVQTLLDYIRSHYEVKAVYLTVFVENKAAVKCYQKCGFEILEKRPAPERPAMEEFVMRVAFE